MNYTKQLEQMIYSSPQLMMRLQYLRELHADAYLSAGVIRTMVWSNLHDQVYCLDDTEIDVIFYDLKDQLGGEERRLSQELKQKFPFLKQVYWGTDSVWSEGYFVTTVGANETIIKRYIVNQGKKDLGQTPFT